MLFLAILTIFTIRYFAFSIYYVHQLDKLD